jgi:hypothetical protein
MAATQSMTAIFCALPSEWDHWLASQGVRAGFCQTTAWSQIHEAVNLAPSFVVSVDRDSVRVAGALVSLRLAVLDSTGFKDRVRLRVTGQASGILECFEGPVLPAENAAEYLSEVLSQISGLAKHLSVNHIRFAGGPVLAPWVGSEDASRTFQKFGYQETSWLTRVIDITQDEEVLRRNLKQAARKGIRRSIESGLTVKLCDSRDQFFGTFCNAYYETAEMGDAKSIVARNDAFWRADRERSYRFFVVEDSGSNVHAVLGTYRYQGVVTEIMSGRTNFGKSSNLPAQDLLHWEAMLYHKRSGDRYFNLAGYSPNPANEKEAGIRRFKEKWGGREVSVPSYTWSREPGYMPTIRWLRSKVASA